MGLNFNVGSSASSSKGKSIFEEPLENFDVVKLEEGAKGIVLKLRDDPKGRKIVTSTIALKFFSEVLAEIKKEAKK